MHSGIRPRVGAASLKTVSLKGVAKQHGAVTEIGGDQGPDDVPMLRSPRRYFLIHLRSGYLPITSLLGMLAHVPTAVVGDQAGIVLYLLEMLFVATHC